MIKDGIGEREIKAVILAGGRDFGRCPLASRLPSALWPVTDKPVLEQLLMHLRAGGINQAVICCREQSKLLEDCAKNVSHMQLQFLEEELPAGTAGCIRDSAAAAAESLFVIMNAATVSPPAINMLIQGHLAGKCDLSVVFNPAGYKGRFQGTSDIYVCDSTVLDFIPAQGYFDIKEGLVPAMVAARKSVRAVTLNKTAGNFRNHTEYLAAIANYLENGEKTPNVLQAGKKTTAENVRVQGQPEIAPDVRVYGPVVIMDGARVEEKAVIFGPAIIGKNTAIGRDSLVENSVLWAGARVGQNCRVRNSVIDYKAFLYDHSTVENKAVVCQPNKRIAVWVKRGISTAGVKSKQTASALSEKIIQAKAKLQTCLITDESQRSIFQHLAIGILIFAFLWSYWPQLKNLWNIWRTSDEYSSGLLVPFLAVYILWARREKIAQCRIQPSLWGLAAFIAAQALRYFGVFFMYASAERIALVLSIGSLALLVFGKQVLNSVLPVIAFLFLMLPLPRSVHGAVMLPLQNLATTSAVFFLETLGYSPVQRGNIIVLNDTAIAVAEACNGLRMATSFFVITALVVFLVRRQWWEKLVIIVSALPIALLCNSVRLTITTMLSTVFTTEGWQGRFHNFSGYAMMPLALAIVVFELWILKKLTIVPDGKKQQPIAGNLHCNYVIRKQR